MFHIFMIRSDVSNYFIIFTCIKTNIVIILFKIGLTGDLKGKYYSLATMSKGDEQKLIDDHFLFQKPTGHLMTNSTAVRDWPDARGILTV